MKDQQKWVIGRTGLSRLFTKLSKPLLFSLKLVGLVMLIGLVSFFVSKHYIGAVAPLTPPGLPLDVQYNLVTYDLPGNPNSQCQQSPPHYDYVYSWLSTLNDPKQDSLTIGSGQSIDLQINTMIFVCYKISKSPLGTTYTGYPALDPTDGDEPANGTATLTGPYAPAANLVDDQTELIGISSSKGGSFSNLWPKDYIIVNPTNYSRYWFGPPVGFTYTAPVTASPETDTITLTEHSLNQFYNSTPVPGSSQPIVASYCVEGGGYPFKSIQKCTDVFPKFNIGITTPSPKPDKYHPTISGGSSCVTELVSGIGNDSDWSSPPNTLAATYTVDGGAPQPVDVIDGAWQVNMSGYPQDKSYQVVVTLPDYNDTGGTSPVSFSAASTGKITYGPCYEPFFSVRGGDVLTGSGGFDTLLDPSCNPGASAANAGILAFNNAAGYQNGSADNLVAYSPNIDSGFATGDGIGFPTPATGYSVDSPEGLTFANSGQAPGTYSIKYGGGVGLNGSYGCASDYYDTALAIDPGIVANGNVANGSTYDIHDAPTDSGNWPPGACTQPNGSTTTYCFLQPTPPASGGSGYIKLTDEDGTPFNGGNLVVVVYGDVVINDNMILDEGSGDTWTSVSSIPSFTLIDKGNIYVSANGQFGPIDEIDGVYIAQRTSSIATNGYVFTCTNGNGNYNLTLYTSCSKNVLTVNGAIVANQLRLNRTLSYCDSCDGGSVVPAEIFNYGPNVWMVNPFAGGSSLPTTPSYQSITALPPVL